MCMESLKTMKQCLISCAQSQMSNLDKVDAKELGEVIDMIKDIEEALYYCTITEAMNEKGEEGIKHEYHYYTQPDSYNRDIDRNQGKMYYTPMSGSRKMYQEMSDPKEGRSHWVRKSYMESKEMHKDKASQLKELEKYMQELTQDMVEMIEDASPEERQYLEKRVSALASKIGQVK